MKKRAERHAGSARHVALPPKLDIVRYSCDVRFAPMADTTQGGKCPWEQPTIGFGIAVVCGHN